MLQTKRQAGRSGTCWSDDAGGSKKRKESPSEKDAFVERSIGKQTSIIRRYKMSERASERCLSLSLSLFLCFLHSESFIAQKRPDSLTLFQKQEPVM